MSAVHDGRYSPWVMCSCSVVRGNQIRDIYLPFPVCLNCRCVFRIVVLFSDLSLCFQICRCVFRFVIVFSDLL